MYKQKELKKTNIGNGTLVLSTLSEKDLNKCSVFLSHSYARETRYRGRCPVEMLFFPTNEIKPTKASPEKHPTA